MFIITEKSGIKTETNDIHDVNDIILGITGNEAEALRIGAIAAYMVWGASYSTENYTIKCVKNETSLPNDIKVPVDGGVLDVSVCQDPNYPGVDIEFIPFNEKDDDPLTRPRILFEKPLGESLRVLVWDDPNSEDYRHKIEFAQK